MNCLEIIFSFMMLTFLVVDNIYLSLRSDLRPRYFINLINIYILIVFILLRFDIFYYKEIGIYTVLYILLLNLVYVLIGEGLIILFSNRSYGFVDLCISRKVFGFALALFLFIGFVSVMGGVFSSFGSFNVFRVVMREPQLFKAEFGTGVFAHFMNFSKVTVVYSFIYLRQYGSKYLLPYFCIAMGLLFILLDFTKGPVLYVLFCGIIVFYFGNANKKIRVSKGFVAVVLSVFIVFLLNYYVLLSKNSDSLDIASYSLGKVVHYAVSPVVVLDNILVDSDQPQYNYPILFGPVIKLFGVTISDGDVGGREYIVSDDGRVGNASTIYGDMYKALGFFGSFFLFALIGFLSSFFYIVFKNCRKNKFLYLNSLFLYSVLSSGVVLGVFGYYFKQFYPFEMVFLSLFFSLLVVSLSQKKTLFKSNLFRLD